MCYSIVIVKSCIIAAIVCCIAVHLFAKPNDRATKNENATADHAPHTVTFVNNEESTAKAETAHSRPPRWYTSSEWWLVIIAALTGLAIAYQARETARATGAIERQVEQMIEAGKQTERIITRMNDTAVRELRAYVCLSAAQIAFKKMDSPEIEIHMKNCGQTPAYDVHWWMNVWIAPHPLSEVLPEPSEDFQMGKAILPPGGHNILFGTLKYPIQPQYSQFVGTPMGTIYAYGTVTYKDTFGNKWHTDYRMMFGGAQGVILKNKNGIPTGPLKPDREGNDAT